MKTLMSFALLAFVMLLPTPAYAGYYEEIYVVYWDCGCPVGPPICNEVVGEWTYDCNGNWIGWGWKPNEYNCTYYDFWFGDECYWQASTSAPPALGKQQGLFANASMARKSDASRACPKAPARSGT